MVDEPDYLSRAQTRRSFLAATGTGTAAALAGCFGGGNQDLETLSDITSSTTVSPTPSGSGTAPALERALDHATDGYERVNFSYGEQGNAMNENQLDVGVGTLMNFAAVPSWLEQITSEVDMRVLDVEDSTAQAWEDDERLLSQTVDTGQIESADTPGEIPAPTFAYNFVSRADLDYDTVYTFLESLYEQRGELADYHALLGTHEDEEFWVKNMYDDVPFHPAAADFYEEIGVWSDEFERADGDSSSDGTVGAETVRMQTATESTTAYAANQGIASAVNDQTDDIFVEAQTSQGTEQNIGALQNEEAEMVYVQNWSAQEVREGNEPFGDLNFQMAQIVHFYDLPWFFIADGGE